MAAAHATSADDDHHSHDEDGDANGKRRRVQRACDVCRKKKIRCDGLQPEKGACSNCASYGHECTFIDATKRRAPPRSYVIALEARMERAEKLIIQLLPTIDLAKAIGPMPELPSEGKKEGEEGPSNLSTNFSPMNNDRQQDSNQFRMPSQQQQPGVPLNMHQGESSDMTNTTVDSWQDGDDEYEEFEEEEDAAFIRVMMDKVNIATAEPDSIIAAFNKKGGKEVYEFDNREDSTGRSIARPSITDGANDAPLLFYGKASGFHIVPHLNRILKEESGNNMYNSQSPSSDLTPSFSDFGLPDESDLDLSKIVFKWPSKELEEKLIQLYFERANPQYPILNEIVFKKQMQKPDWKTDNELIMLALGVFATASRYLTDAEIEVMPRLPGDGEHWAYLLKHLLERGIVPISSKITYIQSTLLCTIYVIATPMGFRSFAWICLGVVVRLLQDMGAHRKFTATSSNFTLLTEETYRRLWWSAYVIDRLMSADMGRPVSIQDEDIDLDDILVVDDKYVYEANEKGIPAEQPADKPSVYHGFLQTLRLTQILGRTLRTIYAISKSKAERGFIGKKWDAYIVAEIDKSLNKWLENVPAHLAYSPSEVNTEWLVQSSRIFLIYYSTQALVHRPFVQRYKMATPMSFHSLAIVSNSARSGIHIMSNLTERGIGSLIGPEAVLRVFIFSSSLLLISYSAARKSYNVSSTLIGDVMKGLESLKKLQSTWKISKRFANRLEHILKHTDISNGVEDAPNGASFHATGKRHHEDESVRQQQQQIDSILQQQNTLHVGTREIRGMKSNSNLASIATKLPLSTTELQGGFGNSPSSALDQVAALSGWQQNDSVGLNAQMSSLTSSGISNPTIYSTVPAPDPNFNTSGNGASNFSSTQGNIETNNQPIFNAYPELFANNTSFADNANMLGDRSVFGNEQGAGMLDPNGGALRSDAFFGGSQALPTPGFELNSSMFGSLGNGGIGMTGRENQGWNDQQQQQQQQQQNLTNQSQQGTESGFSNTNNRMMTSDPLDALSNLNSFWSDSDWMRAIQDTHT